MHIRIIKRPLGEAPEGVRDAWIGLLLPVVPRYSRVVDARGFGVLSRPKSWITRKIKLFSRQVPLMRGYVVDAATAMNLLEKAKPMAAAWWRTNVPHLFKPGRPLLFDENCCAVEDPLESDK